LLHRTPGGQILAASVVDMGPDEAKTNPDRRPGRYDCLSIADTGCGMEPAISAGAAEEKAREAVGEGDPIEQPV